MRYYAAELQAAGEAAITVRIPNNALELIKKRQCREIRIGIDDGRTISPAQQRKAYAMLRDIGDYTGYPLEEIKDIMKAAYMLAARAPEKISLSDCTMTEAREFINLLMEYALKEGIVLAESGLKRTDDIDTYLIQCIRYRRCCVCGKAAEIHHVDAIGMGHDRRTIDDSGKRIAALCRVHHAIAHQRGWKRFEDAYHVYGIERYRTGRKEADVADE